MKNNLYIDGTDAFTRFGVFIAEGGHNEVVAFPALKAPEVSNEWICRILNLILKNLK